MFLGFSLLALVLAKLDFSLLNFTSTLSNQLQNVCIHYSPTQFENHDWISAVVCGKNPPRSNEYELLQLSGLLHLIVVSGSHLVFLEQFLGIIFDRYKWKTLPKVLVLGFFALVTGFQAPVVRALISQLLNHMQNSWKLFWKPTSITLFAGIVSLALVPDWWNSLSLQLSWLASLSLQVWEKPSAIKQQVTIFALMFPLLMQISPPHPVSIIYNLVAAPVVGGLLFPASTLAMIFPKQLFFVDDLWSWFFETLRLTLPISSPAEPIKAASTALIWFYIFGLNIFVVYRRNKSK